MNNNQIRLKPISSYSPKFKGGSVLVCLIISSFLTFNFFSVNRSYCFISPTAKNPKIETYFFKQPGVNRRERSVAERTEGLRKAAHGGVWGEVYPPYKKHERSANSILLSFSSQKFFQNNLSSLSSRARALCV